MRWSEKKDTTRQAHSYQSLKHDGNTNHIQCYNDHIFTAFRTRFGCCCCCSCCWMVVFFFFTFSVSSFDLLTANDGQGIFTNLYAMRCDGDVCFDFFVYRTFETSNHVSVMRFFPAFVVVFFLLFTLHELSTGKCDLSIGNPTLICNRFGQRHCNRVHANTKISFC